MKKVYEVIHIFSQQVEKILKDYLVKVILYGSYARGDYNDNSDVDIIILTTLKEEEIQSVETDIFDLAFEFQIEYGVEISVIVKNELDFNYWLGALPFYDAIEKQGIVLYG